MLVRVKTNCCGNSIYQLTEIFVFGSDIFEKDLSEQTRNLNLICWDKR